MPHVSSTLVEPRLVFPCGNYIMAIMKTIYIHMVRDEPKLPDNSGDAPKPNGMVNCSIPGREVVSLLDRILQ